MSGTTRQDAPDELTLTERLAEQIAEAVLSGAFAPGLKLDEHMLAERFGVSRTPVREALRQLTATGLIAIRPRRGAIVASATPAELEALFAAMAEIEATCARLAALSMTPIERRRLQNRHDMMAELVERDDREGYTSANIDFHSLIYAGAHNAILSEFAGVLRRRMAPFRRAQFRTAGRLALSHAEHGGVLRAILAGDSATAQAAMFDHMSLVEDAFEQLGVGSAGRR